MHFLDRFFGRKRDQSYPQEDLREASEAESRYAQTGDLEALDAACAAWQRIWAQPDFGAAGKAFRLAALNNGAGPFLRRYWARGDGGDLAVALGCWEEAVAETPPGSPDRPMYLNNLGTGLSARYGRTGELGDLARAIGVYEEGCALGLDVAVEHALDMARNWGGWAAQRQSWPEAARAYAHALRAADRLFQVQFLRSDKETWLREVRGLHARAAYSLAKAGDLKSAVEAQETGRARLLSQSLERDRADVERLGRIEAPLCEAYLAAADRLRRLQEGELGATVSLEPGKSLAETIRQADAELKMAIEAIRQIEGYEAFQDALSFEQIQAVAQAHYPLVYLAATDEGGAALVVQADGEPFALWLDLTEAQLTDRLAGPGEALGGYLRAYADWLEDRADPGRTRAWCDALGSMCGWLAEAIMVPLEQALTGMGAEGAVLIPSGSLGFLPLHASGDRLTYTFAPNARAVEKARGLARVCPPDTILAVDNPNPNGKLHLPHSEPEVLSAIETFPKEARKRLVGDEATFSRVTQALTRYRVWHLSTHGRAGWRDPLSSVLVLAHRQELSLRDVLQLECSARLAVLSACETNVQGTDLPDEVISLPSSLLQAGVAGVVGSLWSVNDFSTALLLIRFYVAWRVEGHNPPEALAVAQRWLRKSTKRQLLDYFRGALGEYGWDGSTRDGIPARAASLAHRSLVLMNANEQERPFEHPYYWGGFCYVGV